MWCGVVWFGVWYRTLRGRYWWPVKLLMKCVMDINSGLLITCEGMVERERRYRWLFVEVVNEVCDGYQQWFIDNMWRYGGVRAGRFCALWALRDQLILDKAVDVYQLAKLYHLKRPGIIGSQVHSLVCQWMLLLFFFFVFVCFCCLGLFFSFFNRLQKCGFCVYSQLLEFPLMVSFFFFLVLQLEVWDHHIGEKLRYVTV